MEDHTKVVIILLAIIVAVLGGMFGYPKYRIYNQTLRGEAVLREAEFSRQVRVEEAEALRDAAVLLAERDSIQALGAASANRILGASLKGNEAYLRYLWIQGLQDGNSEVIYIPTEANLPILEATRILGR